MTRVEPQGAKGEIAFDQIAGVVADHDSAGIGDGLHARGEINGVTDRRVFSLPVAGLDRTHDDFAGVHASPDLDWRSAFGAQAIAHAPDLVLKPQGRVERTLRMILMRHRRAEQSEDAVARRLNHVTVVAAHRVDHQPERGIDDGSRFFRIEILPKARGVDDVDEERGDELALAFRHEGFDRRRARRRFLRCAAAGLAVAARAAPHWLQKREPARLSWPQELHLIGNAVPQALQNFAVSGLSASQLEHRMGTRNVVAVHDVRS